MIGFSAQVLAASPAEVRAAAERLKKDLVQRSFKMCLLKGGTETRCKKLLQFEHKREIKVWQRLAPAAKDPAINVRQLNQEMTACYSPNSTYTHLIDCWVRLADRLDAAKRGVFLLKR